MMNASAGFDGPDTVDLNNARQELHDIFSRELSITWGE